MVARTVGCGYDYGVGLVNRFITRVRKRGRRRSSLSCSPLSSTASHFCLARWGSEGVQVSRAERKCIVVSAFVCFIGLTNAPPRTLQCFSILKVRIKRGVHNKVKMASHASIPR